MILQIMEAEFQLSLHNRLPDELKRKVEDLKEAINDRELLDAKEEEKDG